MGGRRNSSMRGATNCALARDGIESGVTMLASAGRAIAAGVYVKPREDHKHGSQKAIAAAT